ncbi:hypothetical protein ACS0TY_005417 [Phlomoides rotata]
MEKAKLGVVIITLAMVAFLLPTRTHALVLYTRSIWDTMYDPFKILEQSPLDDNALALARAD